MTTFSDVLVAKVKAKCSHVVVGLDPDLSLLPPSITQDVHDPQTAGAAIFRFNRELIDAVVDLVPAVKPQIAFYERFGVPGLDAFAKTADYARANGLLVIVDAKRNDIGSTAAAYADGYIGRSLIAGTLFPAFDVDAITVNAYLGVDGIAPFVASARKFGKGIFVLVKTSNRSSVQLQDLSVMSRERGAVKLYERVAGLVAEWGSALLGETGYSSVGAVVGGTFPEESKALRRLMPRAYFLVPGYGAQGAGAQDVVNCFNPDGLGALISASRSVNYAYRADSRFSDCQFAEAARSAVVTMNARINECLAARSSQERPR